MIIPLRIDTKEAEKFKKYAREENLTIQDMIRSVVHKSIRNAEIEKMYREALEDFQLHPKIFSFSKVKKECAEQ